MICNMGMQVHFGLPLRCTVNANLISLRRCFYANFDFIDIILPSKVKIATYEKFFVLTGEAQKVIFCSFHCLVIICIIVFVLKLP